MIFFRIFLFSLVLNASIYEDAEDRKISRWKLVNANAPTSISNQHDLEKKSRIITFQGEGTKYTYQLEVNTKRDNDYWLSWEMKSTEDFVIIVVVETNVGERYLIYTPGVFKSYMQYGLGDVSTNGLWHHYRRNLKEDLIYFDNRVKSLSFKSFILKGNASIDNLMSNKNEFVQKIVMDKPLIKKVLIKKMPLVDLKKKTTNTLPIIKIIGANSLRLNFGETYIEEGVSAYDKEDGEIDVVSMENIDSSMAGRYMVLYMATDSDGNMALDKRHVYVGEIPLKEEEEEEQKIEKIEEEVLMTDDEEYAQQIFLRDEKEKIEMWEKELALRERELKEKEKNGNVN